MTALQYDVVWAQTEKAALYLRKKCARYWTIPVASGCGDLRLTRYTFSDVGDKARAHVTKAYPNALVSFAPAAAVEREIQRQDAAFFRAIGRA